MLENRSPPGTPMALWFKRLYVTPREKLQRCRFKAGSAIMP
jgi:hypothetical protein